MSVRVRDVSGRFVEKYRIESLCSDEVGKLESVRRAAVWWRIYREKLYRSSRFHDRLREKLNKAQKAAETEADALMREYAVGRLPLFGREWAPAFQYAAAWKDIPTREESRALRARDRSWWWRARGNRAWYEKWDVVCVALDDLREKSWPLKPAALARARRYLQAQDDELTRRVIESEAREVRERHDELVRKHRRQQEIKHAAEQMLTEIIPGMTAQKRMRKAQAYDLLVNLLEASDVDEATKKAIGRLRKSVEGKPKTARRMSPKTLDDALVGPRQGHSRGRDGALSASDG